MFKGFKKKATSDNKKEATYFERESVQQLLEGKKLPLMILDSGWYAIKDLLGSEKIAKLEKQLLELIKEQGSLTTGIIENQKVKQGLVDKVLLASEALNVQGDMSKLAELETLQKAIVKVSDDIPKQEIRLEEVEAEMKRVNLELTEEAIGLSYYYMSEYKEVSSTLEREVDELRTLLLEKTNQKKENDQKAATLYQYLHNVVGYKHIDKLDKTLGVLKK